MKRLESAQESVGLARLRRHAQELSEVAVSVAALLLWLVTDTE